MALILSARRPGHRTRAARLRPMTESQQPPGDVSTWIADGFPLVRTLEALERWQRNPDEAHLEVVAEALAGVIQIAGARGAVLEITAAPLPRLAIGVGTLDPIPPEAERAGLAEFVLGSHEGHDTLGRLLLDAPARAVDPVVRTLELAVDAAWARAEVHGRAERLEALEAATRAVAAELDIDRVLQVIVDRVRDARRGHVRRPRDRGRRTGGSSDSSPRGIDARGPGAHRSAAPHGRGLLGLIIRDAQVDPARRTSASAPSGTASRRTTRRCTRFLGRAGDRQGPLGRQPVSHGQGRRRRVQRRGRAARRDVRASTPASPSTTPGSTSRSSGSRSSRSGSGSARTSTTGSSSRSTRSACRWRTSRS